MDDYLSAAAILGKIWHRKGTIKGLCLQSSVRNKKKVYALVTETIKHMCVIGKVIEDSKLLSLEPRLKKQLAAVLLHDFLFTKKKIRTGGWMKKCITRHKQVLEAAKIKYEHLIKSENEVGRIPRYVRVNSLCYSMELAIQAFEETGIWKHCGVQRNTSIWDKNGMKVFYTDADLADFLLVFPPNTDFHDNKLYLSGKIILQDKASCIPAFVLAPPTGSVCIDTCAAPGNKTSHLAAMLNNTGRIIAFDRDAKRLEILKTLVKKAGCLNVTAVHADFTSNNNVPMDATHAIVDPSCSGNSLPGESIKAERIENLAKFQYELLMSVTKLPMMKKIVYSTCSSHPKENENVIAKVLESQEIFKLAPRAALLPLWPHRGILDQGLYENDADAVLRSGPENQTHAFFVAILERSS